jgi:hypothetical protein
VRKTHANTPLAGSGAAKQPVVHSLTLRCMLAGLLREVQTTIHAQTDYAMDPRTPAILAHLFPGRFPFSFSCTVWDPSPEHRQNSGSKVGDKSPGYIGWTKLRDMSRRNCSDLRRNLDG